LSDEDRADVFQEVFRSLAEKIDGFCRDRPGGTFRGWLRTITRNKITDHFRKKQEQAAGGSDALAALHQIAASAENDPDEEAQEHALLHRALEQLKGEFEPATWQAFWAVIVEGRRAVDVALDMGMPANAVTKARARVLLRLQEHLGDRIALG
jgi:RNA polymerase sigma-70 factor (ECF subfamily)